MKNIKTFEQFVNESKMVNERRSTYKAGPDKEIYDFMRKFVQDSVNSLGFGYKGGGAMYNADFDVSNGYDMRDLPDDHFAIVPYADGDYWAKRHLKKVGPMFAKDLNDLQNDYNVEFVEVNPKSPEVIVKITKK